MRLVSHSPHTPQETGTPLPAPRAGCVRGKTSRRPKRFTSDFRINARRYAAAASIFPNFWKPGHEIGYEHTFIASLGDFLQAMSRGEPFHPDFEDALQVQRVLEAISWSASSATWVKL